ncbi:MULTISPECIES: hypothetical protein [Spirulina sp. CCY15215]|uniref:hypothetical protein n=1 Tax=Spirulina sp. CCY15215 TaxID=2767591 RepID=UPI001EF3A0F3|nr:hypothetical protein [Spirulina major]
MAVHAYRAILQETQNKRQEAIFSYLDPRRLEMCIDREDGDRIAIPIRSQDIAIKLETIFELHGRQFKKDKKSEEIKPNKIPILPNLAKQLATVNQDEAKSTIWFHWLISIFCEGNGDRNQSARKPPKPNGKRGNWKSKTALEQLSFPTNDLPKEIVEEFSKHSFLDKNENLSLKQIKESGCFDNIQDFCEWLDGLWLEYHLLQKIESIASKVGIIDYGMDFNIDLAGTEQGFQFDLAFTYGYQIFAISCTTSDDRSLCKSKLFEAYLRAQQMGGSEARVALLCFAKDIEGIKAEIIDLLSDKQIKIFGREHLDSLDHEIFEWLQENDAELNQ